MTALSCHLLSVWLPMMLLLPLTTGLTRGHTLGHMTQEGGSRARRSANDTDAPHDVSHSSELTNSSASTQHPGSSVDDVTTPADALDTPHNDSHMGLPTTTSISTPTPPSITTGNASTVLKPAITTPSTLQSLEPTPSSPDDALETSTNSTAPPESHSAHVEPTLPANQSFVATTQSPVHPVTNSSTQPPVHPVTNSSTQPPVHPVTNSTTQSPVHPVTSSVNTNASTVSANTSAAVDVAIVSTAPGDTSDMATTEHVPTTTNATNTTSTGAALPPNPHPEVITTTTTTTTSSKPPPVTPKRSDCPVFTPSQPGHSKSLVGNCLIAIATLAGLATFFMACSIVLCTRLSAAKQRYRFHRNRADMDDGTEMVCISALMPDGDGPPPRRHRIPKSNGALIPITDTDSDGGDNLTLNSFLPDGDRTPCDGVDSRWMTELTADGDDM